MLNRKRNKGETRVNYKLMKYKKMGDYESFEDISADVTLVQLKLQVVFLKPIRIL